MAQALNQVTKEQMQEAFEQWEQGFRISPENYRTEEETRGLSVSQVSAERADYFFELVRLQQAG